MNSSIKYHTSSTVQDEYPAITQLDGLIFYVNQYEDGVYEAWAINESIVTQGDSWEELQYMIRDAVLCHFDEKDLPANIYLIPFKEKALPVA